uniref:Uncharacterized protein n=1 Tax=Kalanchoe fedtschenkoi TaxID=63787 RepID=A0A7N0VA08_KALFE
MFIGVLIRLNWGFRFWIFYRAKQDGPVVLGWRHPWEGHGHAHGHGDEHETSH